jgi:Flp pilus assembly protein TadG
MRNPQVKRKPAGVALIYLAVCLTVLIGFAALAVDYAKLCLDKAQAQAAADASALYAAAGLVGGTASSVQARAVTAAADDAIENASVVVDPTQDVAFGIWDPNFKTFTPVSSAAVASATAVQVTVHRSASRGTSIPLSFASAFGFASKDLTVSAIASIGTLSESSVPGAASPWLAGMPNGSTIAATGGNPTPADAPDNSPIYFPASGGSTIRFTSTNGTTGWNAAGDGVSSANPDGDPTFIAAQAPANGINTTYAPLNAMMGIFLDDSTPSSTPMAPSLDFSTPASRDFTTLSPQLKQVFFIGDGLTSTGQLQSFVAPTGATRLYIGTMDMDGWWWDNTGTLNFIAVTGNTPVLVK